MTTVYDSPVYKASDVFVAPNVAALRLYQGPTPLPTTALAGTFQGYPVAVLLGGAAAFDGVTDGLYAWDEVSTTADNNSTVIRPTAIGAGNPGRWRAVV